MKKTYKGSCHCGRIRFEADLDLSTGTGKCNCSVCWKKREWGAIARPADLRLLEGQSAISRYQFGTKAHTHQFCETCGVAPFGYGYLEQLGGDYVAVNVATLDDLPLEELLEAPVQYADGRNDAWWEKPAETRHL